MEEQIELPAWKLKAIERGAIPDPRIKTTKKEFPEKEKMEGSSMPHVSRRVSLWVKPDITFALQRLAVYLRMSPGSSLGEVVERLASDRMEEFRDIEAMIDKKTQGK